MTNYEKIKVMSVEDMAIAMAFSMDCSGCPAVAWCREMVIHGNCKVVMKKWLLQEAEE